MKRASVALLLRIGFASLVAVALNIGLMLSADALMTTTIDNVGAPVQLTDCLADLRTINGVPTLSFNVNFVNRAAQPATAIRFDFRLMDAFGALLYVQPADKLGTFSTGVQIGHDYAASPAGVGGAWSTPNYAGPVVSVVCDVEKVQYVDGTTWQRPKPNRFEPTLPTLAP